MVIKLSGFAKFDVDLKLSKRHFFFLVEELSSKIQEPAQDSEEGADPTKIFDPEVFDLINATFSSAFDATTPEPFKGDLENVTYKKITDGIRAFNPDNYPEPEEKAES